MKKILIATRNEGKFPEMKRKLESLPVEVLSLKDVDPNDEFDVEESAMTLEGNAIIKAVLFGNKFQCLTVADDTGLMVDALDGRPGVKSARYAEGSDKDRYMKLIGEMEGKENRRARFRSVLAAFDPDSGLVRTVRNDLIGEITTQPIGNGGYGYDPVFFLSDVEKTLAQIETLEERQMIDHRGKATEEIAKIIKKDFII